MAKGKLLAKLLRENSQVNKDRAKTMHEDAQIAYRRRIEDLERGIEMMVRDSENLQDLSNSPIGLRPASSFDAYAFVGEDMELGYGIVNAKIRLDVAKRRYKELFGE